MATSERVDVGREPSPPIAFGRGPHVCIGAPLARIDVAHAVGTLLRRVPALQLAASDHRYQPRNVFRTLAELPVRA